MATIATEAPKAVEVRDEMTAALEAGAAHAAAFYASGRNTLVDQLSQEAWEAWDGSDELALVFDPDGIDLPDDADCDLAA
ncbi:hypothetical protein U8607_18185 [Methylobacterium durans]|uniref:hypothetical protein n=1 Tax=Methylobacterium durans TaxID=2202825 RepID=UPI002AFFAC7C|nr:hypothetical protein [Methylobacterium durans]MEA1834021.1 hypothetical protein [Methylobacterium durans]